MKPESFEQIKALMYKRETLKSLEQDLNSGYVEVRLINKANGFLSIDTSTTSKEEYKEKAKIFLEELKLNVMYEINEIDKRLEPL